MDPTFSEEFLRLLFYPAFSDDFLRLLFSRDELCTSHTQKLYVCVFLEQLKSAKPDENPIAAQKPAIVVKIPFGVFRILL